MAKDRCRFTVGMVHVFSGGPNVVLWVRKLVLRKIIDTTTSMDNRDDLFGQRAEEGRLLSGIRFYLESTGSRHTH